MDFQLTEEQKMLKKLAHDIAEKEFRPIAEEIEKRGEPLPRKYLKFLADQGLLGIPFPEKYEGQGLTAFEAILVIEEFARVCPATAMPVFESSVGPVRVIEQFGTEGQKQKYLPPVCRGEILFAVGMTEPEAGTALTDLKTRGVLDKDHFVINGQKRFITGGGDADVYIVYIRLSDAKGARGIGGIIVEKGTSGFTFGKQEELMGLRGIASSDLIFEDCKVTKENLVIKEGEFKKLMTAFDLERCGNATMSLGIAQGALEAAIKYSTERKQFGKEICEFQAVQLMLADMALKVEAARLLIYRAVTNAGEGFPSILESNLAKCFSNEMVRDVTSLALQVHGGYGYSKEYPLERMLRDGWAWGLAGGTTQIQKVNIASQLVGRRFDHRR